MQTSWVFVFVFVFVFWKTLLSLQLRNGLLYRHEIFTIIIMMTCK